MEKHRPFQQAHFRGELSGAPKYNGTYTEFVLKTKPIKKETIVVKVRCRVYDNAVLGTFYKRDYMDVAGMLYIKRTLDAYSKTTDGFILVEGVRRFGDWQSKDTVPVSGVVEVVDSGQMSLEI